MKNLIIILGLLASPSFAFGAECNRTDPKACIQLGREAGDKKDKSAAKNYYSKACDFGEPKGCVFHGWALYLEYLDGWFEGEKKTQAVKSFREACDKGTGLGCAYLGHVFTDEKNESKALEMYKKGCELNSGTACFMYGRNLSWEASKEGKLKDEVFRKACDLGEAGGCYKLIQVKMLSYEQSKSGDLSELLSSSAEVKKVCADYEWDDEIKNQACAIASKLAEAEKREARKKEMGLLTHKELHKMANVGMSLGKKYWVTSEYSSRGGSLIDPEGRNSSGRYVGNFLLLVVSEDALTTEQRSRLYDLRGAIGCFQVAMAGGKLEMLDLKKGACE